MRYKLARTAVVDPCAASPEWEKAETGYIRINRWRDYAASPATTFKLLRGPEGISLRMHTEETHLRAACREENGEICEDSCMEFFLKPNNLRPEYLNFEVNPCGVLHLGIGSGRENRRFPEIDHSVFRIESEANEGDWTLKLYIPNRVLLDLFGEISPITKANFYKCGDSTDHVHYGTWSEVEVPEPDFHQPDFFGFLEM